MFAFWKALFSVMQGNMNFDFFQMISMIDLFFNTFQNQFKNHVLDYSYFKNMIQKACTWEFCRTLLNFLLEGFVNMHCLYNTTPCKLFTLNFKFLS